MKTILISNFFLYDVHNLKNIPMNFDVNVNNVFVRKYVLVSVMSIIAIRNNFQFMVQRSSKTRYCIVCLNLEFMEDERLSLFKIGIVGHKDNFERAYLV